MAGPKKIICISRAYGGHKAESCADRNGFANSRRDSTGVEHAARADAISVINPSSEGRTLLQLTRTSSSLNRSVVGRTFSPESDKSPPKLNNEVGFRRPKRSGLDVRLPNLRALRPASSNRPWKIESNGVHLTVTPKTLQPSLEWERWQLTVDIEVPSGQQWSLNSTRLLTAETSILQQPKRSGNRVQFSVLVKAPLECTLHDARQPVKLVLEMTVDGRQETRTIELDHRCLIGDSVKNIDARHLADLAEKYLHDPIIERMVERAKNIPRGSVQSEVARLRNWLGFDSSRWLSDPPEAAEGFEEEATYILAPVETARLGGDCEDYAILQAAYLTRRGFSTYIVFALGHAWVQVAPPKGGPMVTVDWLPGGKRLTASSQARARVQLHPSNSPSN